MEDNKMAEVAKLFGVDLEEAFDIEGSVCNPYKLTLQGIVNDRGAVNDSWLSRMLRGDGKIIKRPWRPKIGERYWVTRGTFVDYLYFNAYFVDYLYYKSGNLFKTREEAEANTERMAAEMEEAFAYVE